MTPIQRNALGVVVTLVFALAPPARATDWSVSPATRFKLEYQHNPVLVPRGTVFYVDDALNANSTLSAPVAYNGERLNLTINPRLWFVYYPRESFLNQNNQYLDLTSSYKYTLTTWSGTLNLVRDTTLTSEPELTGLTAGNRRHESIALGLGPTVQVAPRWTVTGLASWLDHDYPNAGNTGLTNYNYESGDIKTTYLASERTQLSFDTSAGRLHVPAQNFATKSYAANLSGTTQFSELWSATVSAGPSYVESKFGNETGADYLVSVQRTGQTFNISAKISREIVPTGHGVLTRRDLLSLVSTRTLSDTLTLELSGRIFRNRDLVENPLAASPFTIYYLPPGQSLPQNPSFTVRYYNAEGDLIWRLTRNWDGLLSFRFDRSELDYTSSAAQGYSVGLELVWRGNPRIFRQ